MIDDSWQENCFVSWITPSTFYRTKWIQHPFHTKSYVLPQFRSNCQCSLRSSVSSLPYHQMLLYLIKAILEVKCQKCWFKTCLNSMMIFELDFWKLMCHKRIFEVQDKLAAYCTKQVSAWKMVSTFKISIYILTWSHFWCQFWSFIMKSIWMLRFRRGGFSLHFSKYQFMKNYKQIGI